MYTPKFVRLRASDCQNTNACQGQCDKCEKKKAMVAAEIAKADAASAALAAKRAEDAALAALAAKRAEDAKAAKDVKDAKEAKAVKVDMSDDDAWNIAVFLVRDGKDNRDTDATIRAAGTTLRESGKLPSFVRWLDEKIAALGACGIGARVAEEVITHGKHAYEHTLKTKDIGAYEIERKVSLRELLR